MTLLIITQNWTTPIAHYLLDLAWSNYSQQTLYHLFARIHDQERWHARYGVAEFRSIHRENAALIRELLASLEESEVAA